jgi:hypothetical protein
MVAIMPINVNRSMVGDVRFMGPPISSCTPLMRRWSARTVPSRTQGTTNIPQMQICDLSKELCRGKVCVRRTEEESRKKVPTCRRHAEASALSRTDNTEFLHFRLQGRALHAQLGRCTRRAANRPFRVAQRFQDMFSLGIFEGLRRTVRGRDRYF